MDTDIHIINWSCGKCLAWGQYSFVGDLSVAEIVKLLEAAHEAEDDKCVFDLAEMHVTDGG